VALVVGCSSAPKPSIGPLGGKMLTTNQGDGTMSVVEPATGKFVGQLFQPIVQAHNMEMVHELSTDPNGKFFVVGLMEMDPSEQDLVNSANEMAMMISVIPGYLLKLSHEDGTLIGKVQVDPNPGDNLLSPDGKVAYVSHYDLHLVQTGASGPVRGMDSRLWAIDTDTMTAISSIPICAAAHVLESPEDGKTVYATCLADEVAVVDVTDPAHMSVIRVQETPGAPEVPTSASYAPFALQVSPHDGSVWVSNFTSKDVRVMDVSTQPPAFKEILPINATPVFMTFNKAGDLAYLAHKSPDGVTVFDGLKRTILADHPLQAPDCINPHQVVLSDDEKSAYVLCEGDHNSDGQYAIVDLATWSVTSSTRIGIYPVEMDILPALIGG
jgi:DNA-binding beta-propeller fold protein YncE